jgi:hypothetical protein
MATQPAFAHPRRGDLDAHVKFVRCQLAMVVGALNSDPEFEYDWREILVPPCHLCQVATVYLAYWACEQTETSAAELRDETAVGEGKSTLSVVALLQAETVDGRVPFDVLAMLHEELCLTDEYFAATLFVSIAGQLQLAAQDVLEVPLPSTVAG